MAGWQDAPIVAAGSKWQSAPIVSPADQPRNPQASSLPGPFGAFQNATRAFQTGMVQGGTGNFVDELNAALMTPIQAGVDAFQGKGFDLGASYNRALEGERQAEQQQRDLNPLAAGIGDVVGGVTTGGTLAKGGVTLMNGAKPVLSSLVPRAAAEGAAYGAVSGLGSGDTMEQRLHQAGQGAVVGGALGGIVGGAAGAVAGRAGARAVPSVDALKGQAGALYDAAEARGVTFPQPAVKQLADDMAAKAITEGIDPTLHPRATAALKRMQEAGTTGMTVKDAQTLRRVLAAAGRDYTNPDEGRLAGQMLDALDNFTANAAPELAQARGVYHQAKKGELIDQAIELAGSRAGQFSGSGYENALRTEFRALDRKIIKGQLKGLSQEEIDAIRKVANGGPIENALRFVGKLAPTGVVSMMGSGGVPFMIGNAFGGPGVGAAAAGASMATGAMARSLATGMTAGNAARASAMARNGGRVMAQLSPKMRAIVELLLAGEGSQSPKAVSAINPLVEALGSIQ